MTRQTLRRLFIPLLAMLPLATFAGPESAPQNPAGFVIHRGTNLSHWLSQDFGWAPRDSWITEKDIRLIGKQGFDHVRLPIDEKELWRPDGQPNNPEFERLLKAIDWCRKVGLRVIVDLHTVNSHHFNAANEGMAPNALWTDPRAQEQFLGLWRELSARLCHLPVDAVAYEILNEAVADRHEDWNRLAASAIKMLRATEPNRVIILGANRWQIPVNIPFLRVPAGDKNIILSFHTYSPMLFTHHLADWVPTKTYTGPVNYPGPIVDRATYDELMKNSISGFTNYVIGASDEWNAARLRQDYEPAIRRARELGLQLYCGEFGCMPTVPRAARLAYYRDIIGVFEAEGIAWANWEYKGDFGVFEWRGKRDLCGALDTKLIEALMQRH
jgi:endoglucanase